MIPVRLRFLVQEMALALYIPILYIGCAHGVDYKPVEHYSADKALVYFYRPETSGPKGGKYSIKYIETELGKLRYGGYFTYLASPGRYTFYYEGRYGYCNITVDLSPGEIYYIRLRSIGFLGSKLKLELVPALMAQVELLDCRNYP